VVSPTVIQKYVNLGGILVVNPTVIQKYASVIWLCSGDSLQITTLQKLHYLKVINILLSLNSVAEVPDEYRNMLI
jgi:hypothetical protein